MLISNVDNADVYLKLQHKAAKLFSTLLHQFLVA